MEKEIILITGSSSGIGKATALLLSEEFRLILCGRNTERLEETLRECKGDGHLIWPFDLSNVDEIEKDLSAFLKVNKLKVSGLAHCAGTISYVPIKMFTPVAFEDIFRVNVISAAILLKVLTSRRYNEGALKSVALVSSNISNFGANAHCLYSSSKAALDGLMRSAAVELAPKVRVNSVLPGALPTSMTKEIFANQELVDKMLNSYPMGAGETKDIALAIKFLLSEASHWITGQQITVDGGRTINLSV